MATIKSFTDLSQSKILSKILPIESADMYYWLAWRGDVSKEMRNTPKVGTPNKDAIKTYWCPCWSLAALLEQFFIPLLTKTPEGWQLSCLTIKGHKPMIVEGCADPIEACYKMIVKLHEMKML